MNIRQAIGQVETAVRAYLARDEQGMPLIPTAAQRPLYLVGPPGVGKTAILGQIAARLDVGLAAYTMSHHTRQSALGLPALEKRSFGGREVTVTEYTMSEIVASAYQRMEETGKTEGILFLDEINCVSETLMPAMLELLQHKRFGQHPLPEGWVIVCAGNPEKYNRAARSFDPVTLDRVRTIRIEPDLDAWMSYAEASGIHPAVRAYLHLRPEDFYVSDGDQIVTARSWADLSDMMRALEAMGQTPEEPLFEQYLQSPAVAEAFGLYFALCHKVSQRFQLDELLDASDAQVDEVFKDAAFDEALFARTLLGDRRRARDAEAAREQRIAQRVRHFQDGVRREAPDGDPDALARVAREHLARLKHALEVQKANHLLTPEEELEQRRVLRAVSEDIRRRALK